MLNDFSALIDEWIATAEASEKGCRIHFVQGNHDDASDLDAMLKQKAIEHPEHFFVHPVAVRIGATLFTHGDLPLRSGAYHEITTESRHLNWERPMGTRIYKELEPPVRTWAEFISKTGNAWVHNPVQNTLDTLIPLQTTVNALYDGLKDSTLLAQMPSADGTFLPAVTDIVTGHTHNPFTAMKPIAKNGKVLSEIRFHNTGTALVKDRFNPWLITVGKDQLITVSPYALANQKPYYSHEHAKVGGYTR